MSKVTVYYYFVSEHLKRKSDISITVLKIAEVFNYIKSVMRLICVTKDLDYLALRKEVGN